MNNKAKIDELLENRKCSAERVEAAYAQWEGRRKRAEKLKLDLSDLQKVCLRAQSLAGGEAAADLLKKLKQYSASGVVRKLTGACGAASGHLAKLQKRFRRSTINIAVAGVGRSGKSTSLKSLIGQAQSDNSVIPSGGGPAITAGKSIIRCVTDDQDEYSEITFHTAESFLNSVVNPILISISLQGFTCANLDEFSNLDYSVLKEALTHNAQKANEDVHAMELAGSDVAAAKAYADSFNLSWERLGHLEKIMSAFSMFAAQLKGQTERIPLGETARYVSYPTDGSPALCYAVRECRIFSHFPNNDVAALELTDLPGLGTGSVSERQCFLDGFDYSVDLALMVRRPEGLFQNFTTPDDVAVLDVLGKTFGQDHLHECTLLFQNDGGLDSVAADKSFSKIQEWNALRPNPVKVIRGSAYDAAFMQRQLLPEVLAFIGQNLPYLDEALLGAASQTLDHLAKTFDDEEKRIQADLALFQSRFHSGRSVNTIVDKVDAARRILLNGLQEVMDSYGNAEKASSGQSDAISRLTAEAKKTIAEKYNPDNASIVAEVNDSLLHKGSALPYAIDEFPALRIAISEVYAELENVHAGQVAAMQADVAQRLAACFPTIAAGKRTLADYFDLFEKSRCCPEITAALHELLELKVPFYNILYPDLRKAIFESVVDLKPIINPIDALPKDKQAVATLRQLAYIGNNWIWKADRFLRTQSKIRDILFAAVERFQDRLNRDDSTRREMIEFVERNWSSVQSDADAFESDIRMKLEKIAI